MYNLYAAVLTTLGVKELDIIHRIFRGRRISIILLVSSNSEMSQIVSQTFHHLQVIYKTIGVIVGRTFHKGL